MSFRGTPFFVSQRPVPYLPHLSPTPVLSLRYQKFSFNRTWDLSAWKICLSFLDLPTDVSRSQGSLWALLLRGVDGCCLIPCVRPGMLVRFLHGNSLSLPISSPVLVNCRLTLRVRLRVLLEKHLLFLLHPQTLRSLEHLCLRRYLSQRCCPNLSCKH